MTTRNTQTDSAQANIEAMAFTRPSESPLPGELNSLVGRAGLLAEGTTLLRTARLVTLIGTGGVGKTRLLQRMASDVASDYEHGVVVVPLTDLRAADDRLESTIADSLGILDNSDTPGLARLIDYLRNRQVLLMLDNCEHLVGEEPGSGQVPRLLRTLLKAAPSLRVVATSRVKLGVQGEHLLVVPPLCTGFEEGCEKANAIRVHSAQRLLFDRARAVGVVLTEDDLPMAGRLCHMLDGIPLAIELAAVQLDTMTLSEVVEHNPLRLLVDGPSDQDNHRTLRATLDWSYQLLSAAEQGMWAMVSVFEGGFDLEAAEAVCSAGGIDRAEVLTLLARLVRKSLLLAEQRDGRTRYRMLETIRQYGVELIDASEGCGALCRTHADYYAALVDRATREWLGPDEIEWMIRLRVELANLRAALESYLTQPDLVMRGVELAINCVRTRFPIFAGILNEARRVLALALDAHPESPTAHLISALSMAAWVALIQGKNATAEPLLAQAESAARELGCFDTFGPLLYARGTRLFLTEPDIVKARESVALFRAAAEAFDTADAPGDQSMAELFGAMAAAFLGDRATAVAESARYLAKVRAAGAPWGISWALWTCALVELQYGDPNKAAVLLQEALRIQHAIGDLWGLVWSLWLIAIIAQALGEHELAAQLFGGARSGQELTNTTVLGLLPFLRIQQQAEAAVRRELGDDEFEIQVAYGHALQRAEVVDLASRQFTARRAPVAKQLPGGLSPKEFQVANNVAKGMTNRQIGQQMSISFRTVEVHVQKINSKLGTSRRVEIAAWYLGLGADERSA